MTCRCKLDIGKNIIVSTSCPLHGDLEPTAPDPAESDMGLFRCFCPVRTSAYKLGTGSDWFTTAAERITANKLRHGWRVTSPMDFGDDPDHILSVLMLVVTEIAEAAEAVRKIDLANFTEELADVVIRVIGLSHGMGIDLRAAIVAKVEKNATREHKHGGKRV